MDQLKKPEFMGGASVQVVNDFASFAALTELFSEGRLHESNITTHPASDLSGPDLLKISGILSENRREVCPTDAGGGPRGSKRDCR